VLILAVAGLALVVIRWQHTSKSWHFLAIFAILITAFYSAIPYKTPWNGLLPLASWIFLGAFALASLFFMLPSRTWRTAVAVFCLLLTSALAHETWANTLKRPADPTIAFAYSPTVSSIRKVELRLNQIAALDPAKKAMTIYVIAPENDYWPLPWYLRKFENVGYFTVMPPSLDAASIVISIMGDSPALDLPDSQWEPEFYGLRPDVLMQMFIRKPLWDAFIKTQEGPPAP
jgi:predicted membrane-bound mannosyltransferase